jgi:hypothetical protein
MAFPFTPFPASPKVFCPDSQRECHLNSLRFEYFVEKYVKLFSPIFNDLKIVDNISIYAIMAANSQVAMLARYRQQGVSFKIY